MDYTIKELPQEERPREKLEEHGAKSLTDADLLAILLRTGIKGKNVKELSCEILQEFSIQGLSSTEMKDLEKIEGVSKVKAGQLKAIGELATRMQREKRQKIEGLKDVTAHVEDLKYRDKELLRCFYLNSGNEILSEKEVEGGVSSVNLNIRTLFGEALKHDASALILAHNHPSGSSRPTEQDIEVTENLLDAGRTLDVEVLDHVIVGSHVSSMRAETSLW